MMIMNEKEISLIEFIEKYWLVNGELMKLTKSDKIILEAIQNDKEITLTRNRSGQSTIVIED